MAPRARAATYLWLAIAALIGMYLVAGALSTVVRLQQPTEFVYGEAIVLAQVRRLHLGQALYPSANTLPLSVTAYTPVYYLLVGLLQNLTHDDTYLTGRLVSVGSMLVSAGLLAVAVRSVSARWWGGFLAAGLFLTQNLTVVLWASVHRVDALAMCFSLAGLALSSSARTQLASIPLVLAVLTKQTYLVAIPSVCFGLWPRKRALIAFLTPLLLVLAVIGAVWQVLSGGWFLWHTLLANANPLDFDYFSAMFSAFIQLNAVPVIAAAALFALPAFPRERQWRAYFVLAGLETLLTIGKLGASSNYWLELTAASSALIGIQAARLGFTARSAGLAGVVLASLLTAVPFSPFLPHSTSGTSSPSWRRSMPTALSWWCSRNHWTRQSSP